MRGKGVRVCARAQYTDANKSHTEIQCLFVSLTVTDLSLDTFLLFLSRQKTVLRLNAHLKFTAFHQLVSHV